MERMSTSRDNHDVPDAGVAASKNVHDTVEMLNDAVLGLLFTSESDYPITAFQLLLPTVSSTSAQQTITVATAESILLSIATMPSNINSLHRHDWTRNIGVEETTLDWFFRRYTIAQEWWEQSQHADLPRWKHLESIINDCMFDVSVFRIGQAIDCGLYASIDIFIVGRCRSDSLTWLGLHTISVET